MLVHGYYPRDVRVRREAEVLAEAGYNVKVVCLREKSQANRNKESPKAKINNVYVYRLPLSRKRGSVIRYIWEYFLVVVMGAYKLLLLHLKSPFKLVHIHNMPNFLIFAGLFIKCMGAKILLDIHDPMPELYISKYNKEKNHWIIKSLELEEKISCWLANYIITVNESMHENLWNKGIIQKKIFVFHNFPDTKYLPIKKDITIWPRHKDSFVLLYAGTITEHYRLDVVISAFYFVLNEISRVRLKLVGDGNDLKRIFQLAYDLGIIDYIDYFGSLDITDLKQIMAESDVGISTHKRDKFGDLQFTSKILDYLTQGLPVVSNRSLTLMKYFPEDAIFYFDPGNPRDMADQIINIKEDPDLVKRKMMNAKRLLYKYSWKKEKQRFVDFYKMIT